MGERRCRELAAVHLCCGAGGTTLGFEQAGVHTVYAFDIDFIAVETHRANFPAAPAEVRDIRQLRAGGLPPADVWACGIPCEPFSRAGRKLGSADERDISPALARLIAEVEGAGNAPAFVFLENVEEYRDSPGADVVRRVLQASGYACQEAIFCHADYGVAQKRFRWHLIAARTLPVPWPEPTHCENGPDLFERQPWVRFAAIRDGSGIRPVSAQELRGIFRRITVNAARYGNAFQPAVITGDDLLPTIQSSGYKGAGRSQVVLIYEEGRLRAMSFTEARRGQGFPDSFIFRGNEKQRWRQAGQAVPPPFAAAVARAMLEARQGEIA
jgi:DNA (cytosine-5)-methyltransferase 1